MPGCGKSALGRNAARTLRCRFCDLDAWIEKTERRTITEIFEKDGEDGFRRIETAALKTILSTPDTDEHEIISSGGGSSLSVPKTSNLCQGRLSFLSTARPNV